MARRDRSIAEAMREAGRCMQRGEWLSAEGICRYILEDNPTHSGALELLAELYFSQGRPRDSLQAYDHVLQLKPKDADAMYNRGVVLAALGRHEEALQSFDKVLGLRPGDTAALVNRGNALQALGRLQDALRSFDDALALDARNSDAHFNRGNALLAMARHQQAVESFGRVLALQPGHAGALLNFGNALAALGRHAEAIESYDQALALEPGHADAHWNRAWALLSIGDYERGWPEHEWRWRSARWLVPPARSSAPRWLGEAGITGRRVLVLSEQGVGDTLMFLRYVPMLAASGARVVLELPRTLARLCASYRISAELIFDDEPVPPHELQCPMASLPLAFRTSLQTIPAQMPYLEADPELVADWKEILAARSGSLRIGLVWSGNPKQGSEPRRGIGLEPCLRLFDVPGVQWHSLQAGERAEDLARLAPGAAVDHRGRLTDFAETAAAIANLDLVISSDTAVAHLAGAMGKPVWVLLMFAADWRWLRGRDDSPWYPSARLFRQNTPGDWDGVISRVREALGRRT